jgi:hypothetical protein
LRLYPPCPLGERVPNYQATEDIGSSADFPFKVEGFDKTRKTEVILEKNTLAKSLSRKFGIDEDKIALALLYKNVI